MPSMWGIEMTKSGITFIPHIKTELWNKISKEDLIDDLVLVAINRAISQSDIDDLKERYVGQKYLLIKDGL